MQSPRNGVYRSATGKARQLQASWPPPASPLRTRSAGSSSATPSARSRTTTSSTPWSRTPTCSTTAASPASTPPTRRRYPAGRHDRAQRPLRLHRLRSHLDRAGLAAPSWPPTRPRGSALFGTGTRDRLPARRPGLVQPVDPAGPDPSRRQRRADPARLRPRGDLVQRRRRRSALPLDGSVPVHFRVVAQVLRRRLLPAADPPGCPAAPTDRDPTTTAPPPTPTSRTASGSRTPTSPAACSWSSATTAVPTATGSRTTPTASSTTAHWGPGDQAGFSTLMPYFAAMANDGTVYAGLQDNGNLKIDPRDPQAVRDLRRRRLLRRGRPVRLQDRLRGVHRRRDLGDHRRRHSWDEHRPGPDRVEVRQPVRDGPDRRRRTCVTAGREVVETLLRPEHRPRA